MKKKNINIIDSMMFLAILLIGSDIIAINVSGFNFRIVQLLLMIVFVLLVLSRKFIFSNIISIVLFIISNLVSVFISFDKTASIMYTIWTIYNYVFVFCVFVSWVRYKGIERVYEIWRKTFLVQGYLLIVQFILIGIGKGVLSYQIHLGIPRPALWFYEPSYVATYFCIFFAISIYMFLSTNGIKYKKDSIKAGIFIIFITSSTGFLGIAISLILAILLSKTSSKKKLVNVLKIIIIGILLIIVIYSIYPDIFDVFLGRLFESGIIDSSGGRVDGWRQAWNVFIDHKIFGIGGNAYEKYTGYQSPPTNVTLELLCTLGIFGIITFSVFLISIIKNAKKKLNYISGESKQLGSAIIFAFIVFIIVLQANQNYLRLYMWMHMGIIAGMINEVNKNISES